VTTAEPEALRDLANLIALCVGPLFRDHAAARDDQGAAPPRWLAFT
jgi:hypothetical protein